MPSHMAGYLQGNGSIVRCRYNIFNQQQFAFEVEIGFLDGLMTLFVGENYV